MRTTGALQIQKKKPQPHQDIFFNKKIVAPEKLKILVLSGNDIISDELEFIHKCTNLLKLDLSNNHITKISAKLGMEKLTKLEILYLHSNKIQNAGSLEGVFTLPKLLHLTIKDNPAEKLPRIEHLIVNVIPTLKIINERVVFVEQRSHQFFQVRPSVFIQPDINDGWKLKDNSEVQYIKILQLQLRYFNCVWLHHNPIVIIQRAWKEKLKQKRVYRLNQRKKQEKSEVQKIEPAQINSLKITLNKYFNEWKEYSKNRKTLKQQLKYTQTYPQNKSYLTYPLQDHLVCLRNIRVQKIVKGYAQYIRQKIFIRKMAIRISKQLKKKKIQFNSNQSFFELCNISTTKRFYFNKIQTHLLQNFLIHMGENFKWNNIIPTVSKTGPVTQYLSIRTVDPEAFSVKTIYSVFTYSIWPSMKAIFLKKKKYQSKHKTGLIKIKPLYYIKNRNKILTKQQIKKSNKIYKQLQKFYKKQYENSLDYFQCNNDQIMKMLLRYVYYHNSKTIKFQKKTNKNDMQSLLENYEEPFLIYADNILERSAAAVRIQQNWRKYLVNKNSKQSIYAKMKKTRAVLRIQRFWRDRIFYHRLSFQRNVAYQLKLFKSNQFLLPCEVYINFEKICKVGLENQLYSDLRLLKNQKFLKAVWRMSKPVYSPNISKIYFDGLSQSIPSMKDGQNCDIWNLLHFGASINKVSFADNYFYEFKFSSVQEACYRIYLISLFSYKCKNSFYFLPISRETLNLVGIRMNQYRKMGLLSQTAIPKNAVKSKNSLKIKQNDLFSNIKKISILRNYTQSGLFLWSQDYKMNKNFSLINLQFYQKSFQDFPRKYVCNLKYCLTDQIERQKIEEKRQIMEQVIENNKIAQIAPEVAQKLQVANEGEFPQQKFMNITKIDKKMLSFYDYGGKNSTIQRKQSRQKSKTRGEFFYDQINDRRENISRIKVESSLKKQESLQKKNSNIKKLREQLQKQKSINLTAKNLKQIQRTQQLRRKIERVKDMKNRVSSLRKQDSHEDDFIQQGNFVMEQQLKMVIMRNKMQGIQSKIKDRQKSETSSRKNSDSYSKSFYTEQRNKQIKVYDNFSNSKPIAQSLGATLVTNPNQNQANLVEGQETKIVNIRNQKRSKSRSIGAYLRDPSLVHGVFPQEYYPIQTKQGGNFKFFPPLL